MRKTSKKLSKREAELFRQGMEFSDALNQMGRCSDRIYDCFNRLHYEPQKEFKHHQVKILELAFRAYMVAASSYERLLPIFMEGQEKGKSSGDRIEDPDFKLRTHFKSSDRAPYRGTVVDYLNSHLEHRKFLVRRGIIPATFT